MVRAQYIKDPANLFRIAIRFERRAVTFFTERGEPCAPGSPEHQLCRELAAEEREHVDLLDNQPSLNADSSPGLPLVVYQPSGSSDRQLTMTWMGARSPTPPSGRRSRKRWPSAEGTY